MARVFLRPSPDSPFLFLHKFLKNAGREFMCAVFSVSEVMNEVGWWMHSPEGDEAVSGSGSKNQYGGMGRDPLFPSFEPETFGSGCLYGNPIDGYAHLFSQYVAHFIYMRA